MAIITLISVLLNVCGCRALFCLQSYLCLRLQSAISAIWLASAAALSSRLLSAELGQGSAASSLCMLRGREKLVRAEPRLMIESRPRIMDLKLFSTKNQTNFLNLHA
jgi:hypothetical protein